MPRARKCPEELLEGGARVVFESGRPIAHVAADLGVHPEALRKRVRQAEADADGAAGAVDLERARGARRLAS
jgi:transposase